MGGPYPLPYWTLGARSAVSVDVPVTAVFLVLFLMGAATHITIFQINLRRQHHFFLSNLLIGFSVSRALACILRIAAICKPQNLNLTISSAVFLNAGVVLIYLLNLVLARRIVRAVYPRIGWHPLLTGTFWGLCILIIMTVIMVLIAIVQSFFTLNPNTHRIDRRIQLYSLTCFTVVSFLPLPVGMFVFFPYMSSRPAEYFDRGKQLPKGAVLIAGSFAVCLGATYRCATTWMAPVPLARPEPGYDSLGCFYIFYFTMDILIIALYAWTASGFHAKKFFDAVEDSVKRLRTYIDVLQIHRLDRETPREEIMRALNDVVNSGKVRYVGASSMRAWEFQALQNVATCNGWHRFVSMQSHHSLLSREEEREMIAYCQDQGIGLIPWSPLSRGILTRPWSVASSRESQDVAVHLLVRVRETGADKEIVNRVEALARKKGISMAQLATARSLSHKHMCPILGLNSKQRIDEAVAAIRVQMANEKIGCLEEPYVPKQLSIIEKMNLLSRFCSARGLVAAVRVIR
ncbi:voltage-gated shaker-like K+ channel subunit [Penicillium riverlandense]|uniref:voltage-gated shaker-like K+ channel subunit n=1 Tax=Penicillium riverlandense TaxID=1903569 RepID=UPI0025492471|nr:voltage-gated shaker-like K+ channel subunit [Penicillium riverlandense]KAJ5806691.1 voltage-gated shaker-like K+ channel subunit [Penicillium riverlandense]